MASLCPTRQPQDRITMTSSSVLSRQAKGKITMAGHCPCGRWHQHATKEAQVRRISIPVACGPSGRILIPQEHSEVSLCSVHELLVCTTCLSFLADHSPCRSLPNLGAVAPPLLGQTLCCSYTYTQ
ncbi:hypothetical protein JRQ81_017418, partial [Phrynocephalus forsythii]